MAGLINKTGFKAGDTVIQDGMTGDSVWIVAVKGTFDISRKGALSLAEEQVEIADAPVFRGEEYKSSLLYDCDLVIKPKIDLLVNGSCYAPEGEEVSSITAGLYVNRWNKFVNVYGNREWISTLGIVTKRVPHSFTSIPLIYENAYGGLDDIEEEVAFDERNPVGKGYVKKRSHLKYRYLPHIELPGFPTRQRAKKNRMAGFGALCSHWPARARYAGTYDEAWKKERFPLLPLDFNPLFYQCAPEDQLFKSFEGGRQVRLVNMTSFAPQFDFGIPDLTVDCTMWMAGEPRKQPCRLQTVIIEPDYPRVVMVWISTIRCTGMEDAIEHATVSGEDLSPKGETKDVNLTSME